MVEMMLAVTVLVCLGGEPPRENFLQRQEFAFILAVSVPGAVCKLDDTLIAYTMGVELTHEKVKLINTDHHGCRVSVPPSRIFFNSRKRPDKHARLLVLFDASHASRFALQFDRPDGHVVLDHTRVAP
jgi:hypothetical protein